MSEYSFSLPDGLTMALSDRAALDQIRPLRTVSYEEFVREGFSLALAQVRMCKGTGWLPRRSAYPATWAWF